MTEVQKQTVEAWELEKNEILLGDVDIDQEVTERGYEDLRDEYGVMGVVHGERSKWLKENGHEVTRENLANPDLKEKTDEEVED